MRNLIHLTIVGVSITCLGYAALKMPQKPEPYKLPYKSNANPANPSGASSVDQSKFIKAKESFTLQRGRDYHYAGGNVDCPNCKDMYCSLLTPAAPGAKIIEIFTAAQRPEANNHWYRCQARAQCGRPEFSDPNDARLDCIGKGACNVCRATDDAVPNYEDDIEMTYQ